MSEQRDELRAAFLKSRVAPVQVNGTQYFVKPLGSGHLEPVAALQPKAAEEDIGAVISLSALVVCYCLCDENGERLFSDQELALVRQQELDVLQPIAEAALEVSGLMGESDSGN